MNPFVDQGALEEVIHSCPEQTIQIPNEVFHDPQFQSELANFLHAINGWNSDDHTRWHEYRPRYTTQLLTGILRTVGRPAEVTHIAKRVVRRVGGWHNKRYRSEPWFFIKVTIQSSLDRSPLGRAAYKKFMLFFISNLANYAANTSLSSNLFHLMAAKILRRFRKLGATSVPKLLSDSVMQTCTRLSDALDSRCIQAKIIQRASPPWNPSQLDLTRDIQLSLPHCSEYLSRPPTNHGTNSLNTPVLHSPLRGSLRDFLSSEGIFFEEAYHQDPRVALYDLEQVVKQGIDDWIACVTDVDEACIQLEVLVEKYMFGVKRISGISSSGFYKPSDPQHHSVALLTIIELWVALDKLVVKKIPILADYSPEIPMDLFPILLLETMNHHRLCRAHRYLSVRHAQSHPGSSVFSEEFTERSFPIRYYDSSPHLQYLKYRIGGNLLPTAPLHAKVVLFELQCPVSFEAWRSATIRLLQFFHGWKLSGTWENGSYPLKSIPVTGIPGLQCYSVKHRRALINLAYSDPQCEDKLIYTIRGYGTPRELLQTPTLAILAYFAYKIPSGVYADSELGKYLTTTTHMSNKVLSAQADCNADLSLHEFIAFGHVRSGGSLQWMNILKELRSRTLNFRRPEVHLLLAQASAQVGPLSNTGELVWHQDLQDAPFCHILLDELESLFVDVGAGSSDGPVMGIISILASLLASGPCEAISKQTFQLLRNVRGKTFDWVNELLYDVIKSPTNKECRQVLWNMAAICRSTFNVDPAIMHKLLHSAQDIEIALTCAFLMRTTAPTDFPSKCDPSVLLTTSLIATRQTRTLLTTPLMAIHHCQTCAL